MQLKRENRVPVVSNAKKCIFKQMSGVYTIQTISSSILSKKHLMSTKPEVVGLRQQEDASARYFNLFTNFYCTLLVNINVYK